MDIQGTIDRIVSQVITERAAILEKWLRSQDVVVSDDRTVSHFLVICRDWADGLDGETVILVPNADREIAEGQTLEQNKARYPWIYLKAVPFGRGPMTRGRQESNLQAR